MAKLKWLILIVVLAAAAIGGYIWFNSAGSVLVLPGIVEIQEVRLGSKVGGRVKDIYVKEGQEVYPGQKLVEFDVPELTTVRDQLKAKVAAAEAEYTKAMQGPRDEDKRAARAAADAAKSRYEKMKEGWREEEKRQAESDLKAAEADAKQADEDFVRISRLAKDKSVAQADYDAAKAAFDRAQGKKNALQARYDMLKRGNRQEDKDEAKAEWERAQAQSDELENGTRSEDKWLAKAKLDEAKANLDGAEVNLRESVVKVPDELGKAIVEVIAVRPGDLVPAGQPVLRVLRAGDMWVKIFVPETKLDLVPLGRKVAVTIDSRRKTFDGIVMQKGNISEFTPRNVQSADERRFQVFPVKVQVDDPKGVLNAGMAAEVRIPMD